MSSYRWKPQLDTRTRGAFCLDKQFMPIPDTVVPVRKKVERNWLDKLLRRQRVVTTWQSKRSIVSLHYMRRTINCRCAQVPIL